MTASTLPWASPPPATSAHRRPAGPPRAASPARLRLTPRGRVVVVLVVLSTLLAAAFLLGRASHSHAGAPTGSATVRSGDTLWSIAARVAPGRDTRRVVSDILRINRLPGASLQVGQRLSVPTE